MKNYLETNIDEEISKSLNEKNIASQNGINVDTIKALLESCAKFLIEDIKEEKIALVIKDDYGNFKFGAFCKLNGGKYEIINTFNKDDIENDYAALPITIKKFTTILSDILLRRYGIAFVHNGVHLPTYICVILDAIRNYVSENMHGVEIENYFKLTAEIKENKLVYTFIPGEDLKELIANM